MTPIHCYVPGDVCEHCGGAVVLHRTSEHFYKVDRGPMWVCTVCQARVGCHRGKRYRPLGRLSTPGMRSAKRLAHQFFDEMWRRKMARDKATRQEARTRAYAWLARELGVPFHLCHIGNMSPELCDRVVALCRPYVERRCA